MNSAQNILKKSWLNFLLIKFLTLCLCLRYRCHLHGLEDVAKRGNHRILFLANHPALIDPVLLLTHLYSNFFPRTLADEYQITRPIIGFFTKRFGARAIPSLDRNIAGGIEGTKAVLNQTIAGLKSGENLLLYPAGHLKHTRLEEIGATSAVETLIQHIPDLRIVLIRQTGLWGSRFSYGFDGNPPHFMHSFLQGVRYLLLNALLFMPRRKLDYEFVEPTDFPRNFTRMEINRYLENFFNQNAPANTYVPYHWLQGSQPQEKADPPQITVQRNIEIVPVKIQQTVLHYLEESTGHSAIKATDRLSYDLGLDSLAIIELIAWIEQTFHFSVSTPDLLKTVGDIMLAATGHVDSVKSIEMPKPSADWQQQRKATDLLKLPVSKTITEAFLLQASRYPDKIIAADLLSGEKSYRDLITVILLLQPQLVKQTGQYIGIMLPASVAATIFYLATLFAGKTPVMINWTMGKRNLTHSLQTLQIKYVVTSQTLLTRLRLQEIDLSTLIEEIVLFEEIITHFSLWQKISAKFFAHFNWQALRKIIPKETAVVLFTSGSEGFPKAVPLSHQNILANINDVPSIAPLQLSDAMISMLPPFHSYGITVTTLLPLCLGLQVVFHANPTEPVVLNRLIETYKISLMVTTPTFLTAILRKSQDKQLDSIRIVVTGAEKCSAELHRNIEQKYPHIAILEGYGVTECSPVVAVNPWQQQVSNSIGKVLPSYEYLIQDIDTKQSAEVGKKGVLLLRGPCVFLGYIAAKRTPFVAAAEQLWYDTGDLVSQNQNGYLFFEGRLKRFIKLGGEMISLPAIEEVLQQQIKKDAQEGPALALTATADEQNPKLVLFTTEPLSQEQVNRWLREAGFSALNSIKTVHTIDAIPVLGTGKIDYRTLQEQSE